MEAIQIDQRKELHFGVNVFKTFIILLTHNCQSLIIKTNYCEQDNSYISKIFT